MKRIMMVFIAAMFAAFGVCAQTLTAGTPIAATGPVLDLACVAVGQATKPTSCTGHSACSVTAGGKNATCPLAPVAPTPGTYNLHMVWCVSTPQIINTPTGATYTAAGCASSDPFAFRLNPPGVPGPTPTVVP